MKQDRIFDGLSQRFQHKIYQNNDPRGAIRLHITQRDLAPYIKTHTPLTILDAGAGLGQMTQWLAQQQHHVTFLEPSQEMLQLAQANLSTQVFAQTIHYEMSTIQDYAQQTQQQYDVIICHAVLEWLADPEAVLCALKTLLKPQAYLSIMFFNRIAKEFRHLVGGDLKTVLQQQLASNGHNGLAPISPLTPSEIFNWIENLALECLCWSGVRCFYDYSHPEVRKRMQLDDVLTLEAQYSQQEPWRSMARYQHMILQMQK